MALIYAEDPYKILGACFEVYKTMGCGSQLTPEHRAQLHNYLHATKYRLGMLVNFGHHPLLEHERIVI
ncbi:MAG: GxxExxY protein [Gemmataceae bacterium]